MNRLKLIEELLTKYNFGKIINAEILKSSQNKVYKITTEKGIFVVKEYTKDAIVNYYYLKKRKEQIRISEILKQNGIQIIIPLSHKEKKFICYKNRYYLVYNYFDFELKESNRLTINNIKQLALTQSKIHKLNLKSSLSCSYKYINIDIEKQLKKSFLINKELYIKIKKNKEKLNNIMKNTNKYLKKMRKNLCISHNDYKLLNILWNKEIPTLIDFDATGLSNPTSCMCESAFTFSNYKHYINYEYYEEYLNSYLKEYGPISENFIEALYVSFNGKLQWLKYMFSKNHLKKNNYIDETISMIEELLLYYDNIDKFNQIYLKVINNFKKI